MFFFLFSDEFFAPESQEIGPALLGMSLTILGEILKSVSRFSKIADARIRTRGSSFFNCVVRKVSVEQKGGFV